MVSGGGCNNWRLWPFAASCWGLILHPVSHQHPITYTHDATACEECDLLVPATAILLGFALLGWLATKGWFYTGLGVMPNFNIPGVAGSAPNDALALLLFMLAVPVFTVFLSPLFAQMSRKHEFEADAYAVAQTQGADLASALLKLHEDNASTLTPDPVYVKFYYSHPPATERLARISHSAPGAAA